MGFVSPTPVRTRKAKTVSIPTIDLSTERSKLVEQIVKACEEYGFFKVVNHGVPKDVIAKLEQRSAEFFARPFSDKERAGTASPFGYGSKNIGLNGDVGELEYLLLHITSLSNSDNTNFSSVTGDYIQAIREVACDILDAVAEGLGLRDNTIFSRLISDIENDSVLRINHYPPVKNIHCVSSSKQHYHIGFGEHSDPQILTILRSNDVGGLQISTHDGLWLPVPPDPNEFFVMVGDALQVLTNGRFRSVRHRALTNAGKERMSMMYFGAPRLDAWISPVSDMVSKQSPTLYKPFTWGEYKLAMYSLRLGDSRLDLFKNHYS